MRARWLSVAILSVALFFLAAGGWFGARWLQIQRADSLMSSANSRIEKANGLISGLRIEELSSGGFTSLQNIAVGAEAAGAALPLLEEAREETGAALADVRRARNLFLLPGWYYDYLEKKESIGLLRTEQIENLQETSRMLDELYAAGPVIFSSVEEMDVLLGRYQAALGKMQSAPGEAKASMDEVASSMRQIQKQLDTAVKERDFQLLSDLSGSVASSAELVELSAQLAEAAAAGDQARAQQSATMVAAKLLDTSIGRDYLDIWWQNEIRPLQSVFEELQNQQEELDAEAAIIYERERDSSG